MPESRETHEGRCVSSVHVREVLHVLNGGRAGMRAARGVRDARASATAVSACVSACRDAGAFVVTGVFVLLNASSPIARTLF